MIRIILNNRSEGLLATLVEDLKKFRDDFGPWEAPQLVLPNPGVREWVLQGLARSELRVCANMKTNFLDGFWRKTLPKGEPQLKLLDRMVLQGLLLGLLQDEVLLAEPAMAQVQGYLAGEPKKAKALQLSESLARLFEAYSLGRPDWIRAWRKGSPARSHGPEAMEAWQRRLWTAVWAKLKPLPERWLTLTEFFEGGEFDQGAFPENVFIFGLGPFARAYHGALRKLGQRSQVNLYMTVPCMEMWEDLANEWSKGSGEEDPFATDTKAHLALQRWGKAGREQLCQLMELTNWDADMEAGESGGESLLNRLQDKILTLAAGGGTPGSAMADDSIRVLACPGPRREAEAVANEIWEVLARSEGRIRFSDIAVILPEGAKEDYLDPLRIAFEQTRQIPWSQADQGPSLMREMADAARQMLRLGLSDLNRARVLGVLGHPSLRRRWPDFPLEELPEFCERAGIVARLDAKDAAGTYLQDGLWTWERGLQRTALGHFLGGEGVLDVAGGALPSALPMEEGPDLALFIGALLADLRVLRSARQGPCAWASQFRQFLNAYLGPQVRQAREAEARAMDMLVDALERMEAMEVLGIAPPELDFREAVAVADACFERLLAETLGQFRRGVAVAAHGALRGIPFKVMFLMGMGEGVFPTSDTRDPLDLRVHRRMVGDLKRSEQDRHLFMESLLSVREQLVLSYVSRDPITGEELQPSSVLLDLRDILLPALGKDGWKALQRQHRAHRHDLGYFPELDPQAQALPPNHSPAALEEAEALWIGRKLREAAPGCPELSGPMAQWGLAQEALSALRARLRALDPLPAPSGGVQAQKLLKIRAGDLRKWLECQIQGGAQIRLGLHGEDDHDPAELAEEPFETAFLDRRGAVRAALWELLASGQDAENVIRARLAEMRESAKSPAGLMAEGEIAAAKARLEGWRALVPVGAKPVVYRFGPDRSRARQPLKVKPVEPVVVEVGLEGAKVTFLIEGATQPIWDESTLLLTEREPVEEGEPPKDKDRKDLLKAWLDQLLLAAAGIKEGGHKARVIAWKDGEGQARMVDLPAMTQATAKAQLAAWIEEALGQPRWTLMPIEAVLGLLEKVDSGNAEKETGLMEDWLNQQEAGEWTSFSSMYGPLPRAATEAPPEPAWRQLAKARLGGFLEWSKAWEGTP